MTGLFGGGGGQPLAQQPTPVSPAPMPDTNSPGALEARRKAQRDALTRAGRSSTILTAPQDRGGGTPDYTGTKTGAA